LHGCAVSVRRRFSSSSTRTSSEEGLPVFRIEQGKSQILKSEAARRVAPIHRALLKLVARRREDQERLFPQVERSASRDRLTGIFTNTSALATSRYGV